MTNYLDREILSDSHKFEEDVTPALTADYIKEIEKSGVGSIVAVIPAYNEERFIGSVVLAASEFADVVIVVDDGSTDATSKIADLAGAIVVRHTTNCGKAIALNSAFHKALEFEPEVVVALDGDWQHIPAELPHVAEPILNGSADIVIGSRYLETDNNVPTTRIVGHWGFTKLLNFVSGVRVTDSQSGFRAFSRNVVDKLSFASKGFTVESEMQFLAKDYEFTVTEVPITIQYLDRPKRSVISHGLAVLNGIIQLVAQHRPLLFLGGTGFISVVAGLILGIVGIDRYLSTDELPILLMAIAFLFCINGTIAMFSGIILHSLRAFIIDYMNR